MVKRTVADARVLDIEKRRYPSKHYVYIITVTWSDNAVNVIYRRYSKYFDFQMKLFALFPEEAGAKNPSQRMIPFLPGKKLFGRSHTREVAVGRLKQLDEYCRVLVRLPPKISDCDEVIQFFTPTDEDINPPVAEDETKKKKEKEDIEQISDPIQSEEYTVIADYKKQQKNEVELTAGDIVEVFEKGENGWWFVNVNDTQGWAPGTFLAIPGGKDEDESLVPCNELYISNNQYEATQDDEINFQRGVVLNVIQKSLDGWWKVKYQEKIGWVPATYLQEYRGPNTVAMPNQPIEIIGNVMNISDLDSRKSRPLPITPSGVSGTSDDRQNSSLSAIQSSYSYAPPIQSSGSNFIGIRSYMPSNTIATNTSAARALGGTNVKPTPPRRKTVRRSRPRMHRYSYGDTNIEEGELNGLARLKSSEKKRYSYGDTNIAGLKGTVHRGAIKSRVKVKSDYYTVADFAGSSTDDSITFLTGQRVEVLQQTESGWWFVKIGDEEGWAPSTFIEGRRANKMPNPHESVRTSAVSIASLDEETGERKHKGAKPQIGSSNGAFTPVSPRTNRPLPGVPTDEKATPEMSGLQSQRNGKPVPPPVLSKQKASSSSSDQGIQPGNIAALRQQLQLKLKMPDTSAAPRPAVPNTGNGGGARLSPPPPGKRMEQWKTVASYRKDNETEISFAEGTSIEVLEKDESGWWLIRIGAEEGWAPSTFLEKV